MKTLFESKYGLYIPVDLKSKNKEKALSDALKKLKNKIKESKHLIIHISKLHFQTKKKRHRKQQQD